MSFGQSSGPPASAKQVDYLLALVRKAGHAGFRDARRPLGLTQRQSSGKFTRAEASALIDQLLRGVSPDGQTALSFESSAAAARIDDERERVLSAAPAQLLADELQRRGWVVTAPAADRDAQARAG